MGDNKISETAVNEPLQVFSKGAWLYDVTGQQFTADELDEVAFLAYSPHLQGEAVPVAWKPMATCPRDGSVVLLRWGEDHVSPGWWSAPVSPVQNDDGTWPSDTGGFPWAFFDTDKGGSFVNHAVDTKYGPTQWAEYHPQPAEPSEASAKPPQYITDAYEMGFKDGQALAATGKQQVGEVQGSDFDIDDVRELFEKHAKGRDLTPDTWGVSSYVDPHVDNDWNEWVAAWKAIASRQPERIDLSEFRDAVKQAISNVSYMIGEGAAYLKLTELLALIEIRARIDKIDGRDAGAGVG